MGYLGDFGAGAKIFGRNPPRNAMTADLRRLVKTLWNNAALQYNQLILSLCLLL